MTFLYKSDPARGAVWARVFAEKAPQIAFCQWPDMGDPRDVRYLAAWEPPDDLGAAFPNLEFLFSIGAGIDQFDLSALPAALPIIRMTEPGLVACMTDYAALAALALHRDLPAYVAQQREGIWQALPVAPSGQTRVGVLGLGQLGRAVAGRLLTLGFAVSGWSRSRHEISGLRCFAGEGELTEFLAETNILLCLLPLTPQTRGILNASLFARLPQGSAIINAGRGGHLAQDDLLSALNCGHLRAALLDVTEPEPLPPDHPFWTHPKILLTPHIAGETQPETAAAAVLDNLDRHRRGLPLIGLVNRSQGY